MNSIDRNGPLYSWKIGDEAHLSLNNVKGNYTIELDAGKRVTPIENEKIKGFDMTIQIHKVEEVCRQYEPIVHRNVAGHVVCVEFTLCSHVLDVEQPTKDENDSYNKCDFVPVPFNRLTTVKLVQFSSTAPDYRKVRQGLNLRAICTYKECTAYNDVIYIREGKGLGEFHFPYTLFKNYCPSCKSPIESKSIKNLGFWHCQYKVEGSINGKDASRDFVRAGSEKFTTFEEGENVKWDYLKITVKV